MNAGNYRVGGAIGFKIKFLTQVWTHICTVWLWLYSLCVCFQLKGLKTTDNKSTLLHFVAGTVERKFPQVLEFAEDLKFTMAAARGEKLQRFLLLKT